MPVAVTDVPHQPAPLEPPRKRWTRAECDHLEAAGLLDPQGYELVAGELIIKMGKKRPHVNTVKSVLAWLIEAFGFRFVDQEAPIGVSHEDAPTNEPEPDLIVLNRPTLEFHSTPKARDVKLVVEVSDSTLSFDLNEKARLYARAGIADYWVLDVAGRRMVVHRDPQGGAYRSVNAYEAAESVAPLAAPDKELRVGGLFENM